jgi:hypothetical protein
MLRVDGHTTQSWGRTERAQQPQAFSRPFAPAWIVSYCGLRRAPWGIKKTGHREAGLQPQGKGVAMSTNDTFLAIFLGSKTNPRMTAWNALSEEVRGKKMQEGIAAWKAWIEKHQTAIVGMGGPLGKTKKVSEHGIEDINNLMSGYTVVRADSHEAAAKLFEKHPHFTIFPGDSVEIMPVLPIPSA